MAFSRFESAAPGSDSYFPPFKNQSSFCGDRVRASQPFSSPIPFPGFAPQEETSQAFTPWATGEDPYQLVECAKNRTPVDGKEGGSESDLYGLVSHILEEPDPMEGDLGKETLSSLKSVWVPNSAREDSQQYFLSESKLQTNSRFPVHPEPFNQYHRQLSNKESHPKFDLLQSFNGFDVKNQWLFPSSNGANDSYPPQTPDMETVLCQEGSLVRNSLLPNNKLQTDYCAVEKADGHSDHSESVALSFDSQNGLNDYFNSCNTSLLTPGKVKPHWNKPVPLSEGTMLARNMQGLLMSEIDSIGQDTQNRQGGHRNSEVVLEQQSLMHPKIAALDTQVLQYKKEQAGDFRELKPLNNKAGIQSLTSNYYSDVHGAQHGELFQSLKGFSSSFTVPTPLPKEHVDNYSPPIQHHSQQNQRGHYLNQVKHSNGSTGALGGSKVLSHSVSEFMPQVQMERVTSCLTDYALGDGTNAPSRASQSQAGVYPEVLSKAGDSSQFLQDKRTIYSNLANEGQPPQHLEGSVQPLEIAQSEANWKSKFQPDHDILGRVYASQRHKNENFGINPSGKKQSALFPNMYSVGEPRLNPCQLQFDIRGLTSKSVHPYSSPVPFMDFWNLLPDGEYLPFNHHFHDIGRDGPFIGMATTLRSPRLMKNHCAPTSQLHYQLEECYEQCRILEKERKKTEAILAMYHPGKLVSAVSCSVLPKVPPNPSRVDRLIVDQLREQARVVSLLGKMEQLGSCPLPSSIVSALDRHLESICMTQSRRNEEFVNSSNRQRQGLPYFGEERDILLLAVALRDMCISTRKARTALWCAVQMTLPQPTQPNPENKGF